MPKTVAFFLSDFQSGGTEWFALRLARGLLRNGYKPVFFVTQKSGELLSPTECDFEVISLGGHGYNFLSMLKTFPALVRSLRERKPDVLISGLPLLNITAGLAIRWTKSTKLILVEHMRLCTSIAPCNARELIKLLLIKISHVFSNKVVCVSYTVARDVFSSEKMGTSSTSVIYNPVIPINIDRLLTEQVTHPWLASPSGPVIIAIGRLLPVKDYPLLIQAFALVLKKDPTAKLIIFGEGSERRDIVRLIEQLALTPFVSLPGSVNNVFPVLKAASLFVLCSKSEAFGNVVVESLAAGTKVISTDCGGPREILEDGKLGRLVPVGDQHALATAMIEMLHEPVDREPLVQRGLSFSSQSAVEAYIKLIEAL